MGPSFEPQRQPDRTEPFEPKWPARPQPQPEPEKIPEIPLPLVPENPTEKPFNKPLQVPWNYPDVIIEPVDAPNFYQPLPDLAEAKIEPKQNGPKVHRASDVMLVTEAHGGVTLYRVGDDCRCLEIAKVEGSFMDSAVSYSGTRLVTVSDRYSGRNRTSEVAIYALDQIDGDGNPKKLASFDTGMSAVSMSLSDDGSKLAVVSEGGDIKVFDLTGVEAGGAPKEQTVYSPYNQWERIDRYVDAKFLPGTTTLVATRQLLTPNSTEAYLDLIDVGRLGAVPRELTRLPGVPYADPQGGLNSDLQIRGDGRLIVAVLPGGAACVVEGEFSGPRPRVEGIYTVTGAKPGLSSGITAAAINPFDGQTIYLADGPGVASVNLADLRKRGRSAVMDISELHPGAMPSSGGYAASVAVNGSGDVLAAADSLGIQVSKIRGGSGESEYVEVRDWTKVSFPRNGGAIVQAIEESYNV